MDFSLSEDQQAFADVAKSFANDVFAPNAAEWDANHIFPKDALKQAGELGFMGMYTPEEESGLGLPRLDSAIILEQLATGCTSTAAFISIHNMALNMIARYGTTEAKQTWCADLVSGEKLASYCLTEPGAGSDAGSLKTRAVKTVTCWW